MNQRQRLKKWHKWEKRHPEKARRREAAQYAVYRESLYVEWLTKEVAEVRRVRQAIAKDIFGGEVVREVRFEISVAVAEAEAAAEAASKLSKPEGACPLLERVNSLGLWPKDSDFVVYGELTSSKPHTAGVLYDE